MKYPIGLSIILNALAAISILSGCSDYLDREYDSVYRQRDEPLLPMNVQANF